MKIALTRVQLRVVKCALDEYEAGLIDNSNEAEIRVVRRIREKIGDHRWDDIAPRASLETTPTQNQ